MRESLPSCGLTGLLRQLQIYEGRACNRWGDPATQQLSKVHLASLEQVCISGPMVSQALH